MNLVRLLPMIAVLLSFVATTASAQSSGSRGLRQEGAASLFRLPDLNREIAESYITIEGTAEVRLAPDEIRLVLAITAEAETADDCRRQIEATIEKLKAAWQEIGIAGEQIIIDFIAVAPRYRWELQMQNDREVGVEQKIGYRMQSNAHLAVRTEAEAQAAISRALQLGVTDIIAVDYWSRDLAEARRGARKAALEAAREKAELLLAVFDERPAPINVQEHTEAYFPESLYESFTASHGETVNYTGRRDIPFIEANRPRNTYYRGLFVNGDVHAEQLPLKPEISVVSTVRLYYSSPAKPRGDSPARPAREARD